MPRNLQIIASTWDRDSYDLFDYESRLIIKNTMRLRSSAKLIRVGNDCTLWLDLVPKDTFSVLISIIEKNNQFYLVSEGPEKIWQLVKKMRTRDGEKGSILRQGDVIKLGKIILRVKEICIPNSNIVNEGDQCYKLEENNLNFQVTCRICLGDGYTKENPLISPCKCSGTMKYLHLECLQKWLKSKVSSRITESSRSYYWNEFECELCKQGFPSKIKLDGKIINLMEFQKPETPYIILQDLRGETMGLNGLHIISLSKNSLKIGRGHDSDIRIPDSSISKIHAELKLTKNGVLLSDSSSKFGTLLQVKRFMLVPHQKTLSVQVGRTLIQFYIIRGWWPFSECFRFARCFGTENRVEEEPIMQWSPSEVSRSSDAVLTLSLPHATENTKQFELKSQIDSERCLLGTQNEFIPFTNYYNIPGRVEYDIGRGLTDGDQSLEEDG